jgi:hypothetical protein
MQIINILAITAVVIIIALAFYAGMLINKIKVQKIQNQLIENQLNAQNELQKQQRNDNICESIRLIARATAQQQCNLSEAAIRLVVLLETLVSPQPIDISEKYPALSELFDKVKDMPTHDERKKVAVKKLKMMDIRREVFEAELEDRIIKEAKQLENFSQ